MPPAADQPESAAWQAARERLRRRFGAQLEEWWPRVPALSDRAAGVTLAAAPAAPPVLLHGDLHPGNVLDGGPARRLVAIDPRPSAGEPAADVVGWCSGGRTASPPGRHATRSWLPPWGPGSRQLWSWCTAFAAMLAASCAAGGDLAPVQDLLAIAP